MILICLALNGQEYFHDNILSKKLLLSEILSRCIQSDACRKSMKGLSFNEPACHLQALS